MSASALLAGKRVAVLVEEEFEDRELVGPLEALRSAGATVTVVGATAGVHYTGKRGVTVVIADAAAGSVSMKDFDARLIKYVALGQPALLRASRAGGARTPQ